MIASSSPRAATLTHEQGFAIAQLANDAVAVSVIPEIGGKLCSLRNVRSGREWMWRPPGPLRLFRNALGADFATSTIIGADECLPTIGACTVDGRALPDHGEVWSTGWTLDSLALTKGEITTTIQLPISPLFFSRKITLDGSAVQLDYTLENRSDKPTAYLWALHPLLTFELGDRLELPAEVSHVCVESARHPDANFGTRWVYPKPHPGVDLAALQLLDHDAYAKFFSDTLVRGQAAISNAHTGDRLEFSWDTAINPHVGIWLTRGGWKGFHHPAIEPTNAPVDRLDLAASQINASTTLAPRECRSWQVRIAATAGRA